MIACVHLPRFELAVLAGGGSGTAEQSLAGHALAVAPAADAGGLVGEVSGTAEAFGVAAGMQVGEALARCPELVLVPADPVLVAEAWENALAALEAIGAEVEAGPRPGLAYFEADALRPLHGSREATIEAARRALGRPARIGCGPTRFCALGAALAAHSRRTLVVGEGEAVRWLEGRPLELLGHRQETAQLCQPLDRLGVRTLGELRRLGRGPLSDRFGAAGAAAHRLASGEDGILHPRRAQELLEETLEVGDASSGEALQRVLGVLVDRLLARAERRGRTLRGATLSAQLVAGGGWRERVVFRRALDDPERIRLALSLRLALLPAPACALRLAVARFGPPAGEQAALLEQDRTARAERLGEAIAQMRAVAGRDVALRAVLVDPDSRVPERRVVLAPVTERAR